MDENDFPNGKSSQGTPSSHVLTDDELNAHLYRAWMDGFQLATNLMRAGAPVRMPLPEATPLEKLKKLGLSNRVFNMMMRGDWSLVTPWCYSIADALDRGLMAMENIQNWGTKASDEIVSVLFAAGHVLAPWPRPKPPTKPGVA